MFSDVRRSAQSPTNSARDPYSEKITSRTNERRYGRPIESSEVDEQEDNDYEEAVYEDHDTSDEADRPLTRREDPYIAALRHRFPNRPKTDYVYSKPIGPSSMFD
jgi:hypothetical protein